MPGGLSEPIRTVQYGLGPIGLACADLMLDKESSGLLQLVGAIDTDPGKAGRTLGELLRRDCNIRISANAEQTLREAEPHVVLHTTRSFLDEVEDQLLACVRAGAHVVSSTEELCYPYDRHPEASRRLDAAARAHGVVIVGTGVNPGYAMDTLALAATGVCASVRSLRVERVVDASRRREPLQRKIGAGLTVQEFEARKRAGGFGHIGLRESLLVVAAGLDWRLDHIDAALAPVISERPVQTPFLCVKPGQVAGIAQSVSGSRNGTEAIRLELRMFVGASSPVDTIHVDGDPPMDLVVHGGIFGDTATVGALVNAVALVLIAHPGLRTVKDLPVPRAFACSE